MSDETLAQGGVVPLEAGWHEFAGTDSRTEMFVSGKSV